MSLSKWEERVLVEKRSWKFELSDILNFEGWEDEQEPVQNTEKHRDSVRYWNNKAYI